MLTHARYKTVKKTPFYLYDPQKDIVRSKAGNIGANYEFDAYSRGLYLIKAGDIGGAKDGPYAIPVAACVPVDDSSEEPPTSGGDIMPAWFKLTDPDGNEAFYDKRS